MDITEAEDIKKRWQEFTEEPYKKDLHKPDNHDDVITNLEPDILECEVKWALESITTSKASGGDGIPVELFQILKDDVVKVLHSICQQIWKTQQWPQHWKGSVFIPITKKGKKAKWLCGKALQITVKRREVKHKGEKERYKHLNAEFQRTARRDKKAFSNQCKETEEKKRMGRLEISSRKLEIPREHFTQRWA